jgi:hypothetical protein
MSLRLGDAVQASGTVVVTQQAVDARVGGRTEALEGFLIGASGVAGSVRGIEVEGLDLAAALLRPADAQVGDDRSWLALKAEVGSVALDAQALGLPAGLLSVEATSLRFETNQALGTRGGFANDQALDLGVSTTDDGQVVDRSLAVVTAVATDTREQATMSLDFGAAAGVYTALGFDARVQVGEYVSASGAFGLSLMGPRLATLDNGSRRTVQTTLLTGRDIAVQMPSPASRSRVRASAWRSWKTWRAAAPSLVRRPRPTARRCRAWKG